MSNLSDVLRSKGNDVFTVGPKDDILVALKIMAARAIGTAVVLDGEKIVGIFSERDFIRKVVVTGKCGEKEIPIENIMTKDVLVAKPDSSVEECLQLMTSACIRHLPVAEEEKLVGIVSIGDLVKYRLQEQDETIRDYQKYIYQAY